ncbi:membrane hypothetical protein [Azospirillaceae bacterium]
MLFFKFGLFAEESVSTEGVMRTALLALMAVLFMAMVVGEREARAQTRSQASSSVVAPSVTADVYDDRSARGQAEMFRFGTRYTLTVLAGTLIGGTLMGVTSGGVPATLIGAATGSMLSSMVFLDLYGVTAIERK